MAITSKDWFDARFSKQCAPEDLRYSATRSVWQLVSVRADLRAEALGVRTSPDGWEAVVLCLAVPLGQRELVHDIRSRETIAVIVTGEGKQPLVISLREDFPDLPHLNTAASGDPRTFCIYDEPWPEVRVRWTAQAFVEGIRGWLLRNAREELHHERQPLDPVFLGGSLTRVVVPAEILQPPAFQGELLFDRVTQDGRLIFLRKGGPESKEDDEAFSCMLVNASPQKHGRLRFAPRDLAELSERDEELGLGLMDQIKNTLLDWLSNAPGRLDKQLLLIVLVPMKREDKGEAQAVTLRSFVTEVSAGEVGRVLGVLDKAEGKWGRILSNPQPGNLSSIKIEMGDVSSDFSLEIGAQASNRQVRHECAMIVGVGALGSHLSNLLVREGWARQWIILDEDILLPHNLARHVLFKGATGHSKAHVLTVLFNELVTSEPNMATEIHADFLDQTPETVEAQKRASIMIDASASVAVARCIACDVDERARAVSVFLTPSGKDLVVLAEGTDWKCSRIDLLEHTYLRAVATEESLSRHLERPQSGILYSLACRSPSGRISISSVSRHAGRASEALQSLDENPMISVWREDDNGSASRIDIDVTPSVKARRHKFRDWEVVVLGNVVARILELRAEKSPVETGGILLGSWDRQRNMVYVAEALPAPADSVETQTSFVRGAAGVRSSVEGWEDSTLKQLGYVGEWHSHPPGHDSQPSDDDQKFSEAMRRFSRFEDSPALMLIAGEDGVRCLLETETYIENELILRDSPVGAPE